MKLTPPVSPMYARRVSIEAIEEKNDPLRSAATEKDASAPPSDAEVVDFALANCLFGIQEAEDHEMDQSMPRRG
jgi:hypothetical protein